MKIYADEDEYVRMTESPVFGLVLRLSLPTVLSMMITSVYNMVDTLFVSSLGNSAVAAVGVVYSIQSIIQAIGYGFGMGAQSLVSRLLGEKKRDEASKFATAAFSASVVLGMVITVLGLINLPFSMRLFGSTESALPYAKSYGRIILIGAPVFCSSFVLNNTLRGEGKASLSMVGLCSGGILNIALDALFILVLHMEIVGAAVATVISQFVSFLILLFFFVHRKSEVEVNPFVIRFRFQDCVRVFRTGIPTVFRQSLGSVSTTLLNLVTRPYGDAVMAAIGIANKVYVLLRSMLIGVGQGFQPVAGYNYGAKKYDRVKQSFGAATIFGTAFCVLSSAGLFFFAESIMGLFRSGDADVIATGSTMLRYLSISLVGLGYSTFVNQLYQTLGFVGQATFLASLRQGIFFVPLILILPSFLGVTGIQLTQALSDVLTFAVSVPFHGMMYRKYLKEEKPESGG